MIVCGYEIQAGEKKHIKIPVLQAEAMEGICICGKNQGKTLVITAGVHGCEYVGIEAAKRMAEFLEPMELAGNVILIPLVNRCGFFDGRKQVVPEDEKNLNRVFPGKSNGTISERIAYTMEEYIYPCADFLIDLHSGDSNEDLIPLVFYPTKGEKAVNDKALQAAKVLSVPYRVSSQAKNGLYSWAVQKGIPSLLIERGSGGLWSENEVERCMEDMHRIMAFLGIKQGSYEKTSQADIKEAVYEDAVSDGFWYPSITAGKRVCCGEKFGVFEAYADGKRTELCAKFDGVVLYHTTALGVRAGEALAAYGKI